MSEMVVPDGWEIKQLDKFCDKVTDGTHDSPKRKNSGIRLVTSKNLLASGKLDLSSAYYISEQDFVDIEKRSKVDVGDVIFGMIGTIGNPVVIYDLSVPFAIKNVALFKFSGDFDRARWVQYYLDSDEFKLHIERSQTGNAQRFVGLGFLRNTIIPAPPIEEITKIASILTSVDEVIEKTQSQINKLQDLKKGTMNELLTKGIGHTEFKDSPVGKIPVEWEVQEIESVINNLIDYRGKSPPKYSSGVPLLTAKNIRKGYIDSEPREFIEEDKFDSWMVRGIPTVGDVFFTTEAPLGNVALVPDYKFAIGQRVIALCPDVDKLNSVYLLYVLQGEIVKKQLFLDSTGSTVSGVKQSTFRKILILSPPLQEQQKIASIISSMDSHIEEKQRKLEQTQSLKKSLMQDLLTGKVRVTVN